MATFHRWHARCESKGPERAWRPIGPAKSLPTGLSESAINDAMSIGFMFDAVNRLANAFGFTTVDEAGRMKTAAILHRIGYKVPGVLLR